MSNANGLGGFAGVSDPLSVAPGPDGDEDREMAAALRIACGAVASHNCAGEGCRRRGHKRDVRDLRMALEMVGVTGTLQSAYNDWGVRRQDKGVKRRPAPA